MNHIVKESLLFDLYGDLLTEKKRSVMALYHEENLSITEIAEEFGISRAAVYDSLKSAESKLARYEEKLAMSKFCKDLTLKIAEIEMLKIDDSMLEEKLGEMQEIVKELENNI